MSGLEAIGAAAAILQFVDFASKLLVTGYDVYKSQTGATPQTLHTQNLCTELQSISAQLSQAPRGNITLNDREQSLWRLADRAHDLAWHLGLLLDSLKLKKATFKSWRILHQKDKVAEMVARLDEIKSLMDTNLLVPLRDDTSLLIRLVNDQTRQSKHIRDDGINAVQSLKHELLATMQQHRDSAQLLHEISLRKIGEQLAMLAQSSTALKKSERILENLYCEEVHSREFGVSDAVDCTFDWAFNAWCSGNCLDCGCRCTGNIDPTSENRCSDHVGSLQCPGNSLANHQKHLLRWLENKTSEPFVVTGKPGSGKSTFMKFIASHEQTRLALAGWAGDKKLLVARFYFWSSGSPLQRSQEGLLRCLLYQILSQAPEMIPIAVPRRWQSARDSPRTTEPWTRREISEAFSNIINGNPLNFNICFFIDGLDEYGGSDLADGESDLELVSQLKKLASSSHIKLCLSSRSRNVFQKHLVSDESRHIILQNHTAKDIEQFVQLRLESVRQLIDIDNSDLKELQSIIAERSSGVFLWVVLAVRDLLDGLEPPFSMPEMMERLLLLPASLDDFFQRILNKVHQQHRRFVARLLLMTLHQYRVDLGISYSLWSLDKEFVRTHLSVTPQQQQPPHVFPQSWKSDICLRIGKSCGDLLDTFPNVFCPTVSHTHRSVADFLKLPEIKAQLLRHADWQEHDIVLAFCKASVLCCEHHITLESTSYHAEKPIISRSRLSTWVNDCMINAAQYESSTGKACTDLIYKLDSILCSRPPALWDYKSGHWTEDIYGPCSLNKAIPEAHALLFFALIHGLHLFVQQAIESLTPPATATTLNGLLRALVLSRYRQRAYWLSSQNMAGAIMFVCSKGADPNDIVRPGAFCTADHKTKTPTRTIWELYLDYGLLGKEYGSRSRTASLSSFRQTAIVIQGLIEGGADLNCKIPMSCVNIQQAIKRRLEADFPPYLSRIDRRLFLRGQEVERIKAALSKRGFNWVY